MREEDDDVEIMLRFRKGQAERAFKDETASLATNTRDAKGCQGMPNAARPRAQASTTPPQGSVGLSK